MGSCGDLCAREFGYAREQLDEYAAQSYGRARSAQAAGRFRDEIVPSSCRSEKALR